MEEVEEMAVGEGATRRGARAEGEPELLYLAILGSGVGHYVEHHLRVLSHTLRS